MKDNRQFLRAAAMVLASCLVAACATRKQAGKQEYDMMENLTARYNIVYHGRKIIADVERQNFASHRDNYQQLLPVLVEPTEASAAANAPLMDSVIGKALDIINNKTKSKYINEAYLLTGKANYLKGNYYNAVEFFTYVAHTFADMPEYRQAGLVWKARALMQLGNLTEAGRVLDTVFMGLETEKKSVGWAFATQAKQYLLTHDEESAITMLQQALDHAADKPTKIRWHFLLGQLLEQHGRMEEAYNHYSRVVRSNAPYEMTFHAGLNRVFLVTADHGSSEDRVRLLRRMLRDGKNTAFKDQIYYQIGEVFYANGDVREALENYEQALQQQSDNRYQAALTYLKLADHHFEVADYPAAKLYYDSVGMVLPTDFPDAGAVQRKIANLDELIAQLQIVAHQDSLQYLAGLAEGPRQAEIDSIVVRTYAQIQSIQKGSEKKATAGRSTPRSPFDELPGTAVTYTDNRFYFNNPDAMGMGQAEFRRRWGNRTLRDNWRFSDMIGSGQVNISPTSAGEEQAVVQPDTAKVDSATWAAQFRERYLEALPDTDEKMRQSNNWIHDALIRIGNIYRDELRDNREAANTFEALLERYPDTKEAALIYYNLHRLYTDVDEQRAAYYREKLLAEFPDALYSHIIRDPMYLAKLEQQKQVLDQAYERVYALYTQQQYTDVVERVTDLLNQGQGREQTLSQLAYLRALAWGRIAPLDTFEHALRQLVSDFPDDSLVTPLAAQHLTFIDANRDTLVTRVYALQGIEEGRERFLDEPTMTLWPQLVIRQAPERPRPRRELAVGAATQTGIRASGLGNTSGITPQQLARTAEIGEIGPNTYRNLDLLPDSATYYFVVNVMSERVNLAPSRFGIGQFNRTRYAGTVISHQLKLVNDESQLIYIGPFNSYEQAKLYEGRILPLLPDIMKVPADYYNTFVITEDIFGTLSDFDKIDDYHAIYQEEFNR